MFTDSSGAIVSDTSPEALAAAFPNILLDDEPAFLLDTDTYKLSHAESYPEVEEMEAYLTFRGPLSSDDARIAFFGARDLYETLLTRRITFKDLAKADAYLKTHAAGGLPFAWPRDLWVRVVTERNGYLPLTVRAVRDGETIYPQVPALVVRAEAPFARLVTWFETRMMRIWSPTTTATKSAHVRAFLQERFDRSVDDAQAWRLDYALHDFGSRGTSSGETSATAGAAHLVVFDGTDNLIAALRATRWNDGKPVGQSVIASEHSVMTAWEDEDQALAQLIQITPQGGILSCVADTYDYQRFLWEIVPRHVAALKAKQIHFVVRPDSGDPVYCVLEGLKALEAAFGATLNTKGFKVLTGAGVIQGDGIDELVLRRVANAVQNAGFSAQCVVYGMGGGLLQKQNRDTLKTAMKLCHLVHADGTEQDVSKSPKTDPSKASLPGRAQVRLVDGVPTVYPAEPEGEDMLEEIWSCGPTDYTFESFDTVRARFLYSWDSSPKQADVLSSAMKAKLAAAHAALHGA